MNALQGPDTPESAFELAARPITGGERLVALDFIRGVAVLGIAFANVTAFAHPWLAYYWPGALPGGGDAADRWIWLAQFVLIDGKFRGIFTLLFGAGLALFIDRVREAGGSAALQMRRLLLLGCSASRISRCCSPATCCSCTLLAGWWRWPSSMHRPASNLCWGLPGISWR